MEDDENKLRLQVFLARSGAGSRRNLVTPIQEGLVKVNGKVEKDPSFRISSTDRVEFRGKVWKPDTRMVYYVLNKPPQYLCTHSDPEGRPLAISLIQPAVDERLVQVGRLDFLSCGILLFTNDGEWCRQVQHPSSAIPKIYRVSTKRAVPLELMEKFQKGLDIEGIRYRCERFRILSEKDVEITLVEGKNREIRNVFESVGIYVKKLQRIQYGPVSIKGLPEACFRPLTNQEIKGLYRKNRSEL